MRILMLTDQYPPFIGGIEQTCATWRRSRRARSQSRWRHGAGRTCPMNGRRRSARPSPALDHQRVAARRRPAAGPTQPASRTRRRAGPAPHDRATSDRTSSTATTGWPARTCRSRRATTPRLVMTLHDYSSCVPSAACCTAARDCTGPGFRSACTARRATTARRAARPSRSAPGRARRRAGAPSICSSRSAEPSPLATSLRERDLPLPSRPQLRARRCAGPATPDDPGACRLPEEPFLLYVGAMSRHKGVHVLLDAYAGVDGAPPLVIIGRALARRRRSSLPSKACRHQDLRPSAR